MSHLSPKNPIHHTCKVVQCKGKIILLHIVRNRCRKVPAMPLLLNQDFCQVEKTSVMEHSSDLDSLLTVYVFHLHSVEYFYGVCEGQLEKKQARC